MGGFPPIVPVRTSTGTSAPLAQGGPGAPRSCSWAAARPAVTRMSTTKVPVSADLRHGKGLSEDVGPLCSQAPPFSTAGSCIQVAATTSSIPSRGDYPPSQPLSAVQLVPEIRAGVLAHPSMSTCRPMLRYGPGSA